MISSEPHWNSAEIYNIVKIQPPIEGDWILRPKGPGHTPA